LNFNKIEILYTPIISPDSLSMSPRVKLAPPNPNGMATYRNSFNPDSAKNRQRES
jgi:hypothetical protein